ncbi:MAG: trpS [Gammaproteobacteria bacterium]|jgi:tryptophanyl-tRNA synthetase|nr:trpS [Gammaproteobacteria bacterium]
MRENIVLTGITPSGTPHIGNYIGAIKPAIEKQRSGCHAMYFIADYHSLVKLWDAKLRHQYIMEIASSWLALGLDPNKTLFYRQSDVPEILELHWILNSITAKGLLNRAHAYKDQVAKNMEEGDKDHDAGITMGLYGYPVLMAADILMFNATHVPVGKDQIQHIEIARDIAARFNHVYSHIFNLPEAVVDEKTHTLPGLDGRKMSKSYGNTIPLFAEGPELKKLVMKIKTNSQAPNEPKETEGETLFQIYQAFASESEIQAMKDRYHTGIGWGEVKNSLFELLDRKLQEPRAHYKELMAHPEKVEAILREGAEKARAKAKPFLAQIRQAVGI